MGKKAVMSIFQVFYVTTVMRPVASPPVPHVIAIPTIEEVITIFTIF